MIFIDRNNVPVPEIFHTREMEIAQKRLAEFYNRSEGSRSQKRYSKPFDPQLKGELVGPLRFLFKNKCAYCESPLPPASTSGSIENFRPKSNARGLNKDFSREHYWWLTYVWENLYYSCEICNRFKSSWFPVEGDRALKLTPIQNINFKETALLLDPCIDRPEEHLIYNENGQVDFLTLKGRITIEILKLNRVELVREREEALKQLYGDWELFLKLWRSKSRNRKKIKELALNWEDIFSNYTQKPYVAIQRQMLSKWLNNHLEIQEYLTKKEYDKLETIAVEMEAVGLQIDEESKKFDTQFLSKEVKELLEDSISFDSLRHVYIEKIELKNFKCFADLTINFNNEYLNANTDTSNNIEPWLLFLGENGVGKSSILRAITIALCGENYFEKLGLIASSLLQRNKENGFINLFLKGEENPIEVKFDNNTITSNIKEPKANLIGYGSVRLLPKERKLSPEKFKKGGIKAQNLFDYSVSLTNADKWLLERNEEDFDRAAITLKDLMLLEDEVLLKRDIQKGKILIENNNSQLYIDELSDGYQSVYAIAVDIMASFVRDKITYDIAEGIVLIDEIGTHLHPRWKMEVVSQLRRAFPRMQFIVTSHEPLCLRGLKQGEVAVLTKDWDNNIYAITDLPDPASLRVDQILTSPFFGLHSAVDPDTEKLFNEYYSLLAKDNLTLDEENRKLDLSDKIPKIKYLGDTLREELAIYVIDELLAKKKDSFNLDELKKEAKERVKLIWDTLNDKT